MNNELDGPRESKSSTQRAQFAAAVGLSSGTVIILWLGTAVVDRLLELRPEALDVAWYAVLFAPVLVGVVLLFWRDFPSVAWGLIVGAGLAFIALLLWAFLFVYPNLGY